MPSAVLLLGDDTLGGAETWEPAPRPNPGDTRALARILVADDDAVVLTMVARVLREAGYEVTTARHGGEALRIARENDGEFELVITDIRMPVLDGWALRQALQREWPKLPVLFISGYSTELAGPPPDAQETPPTILKPFGPEELLELVARMIQR